MTMFNQLISERDYKLAIAIHYFAYKYTYITPVLGLLMILSFLIVTVVGPKDLFPDPPYILLLLGVFLVVRPLFYIFNVFNSIKSSKLSLVESTVNITADDTITTSTGGNINSFNLKDLYAYLNAKSFIFLYVARNQYLILDKRRMDQADIDNLFGALVRLNIKER